MYIVKIILVYVKDFGWGVVYGGSNIKWYWFIDLVEENSGLIVY